MPSPTHPAYIPSFSFLKGAFGKGRTPAKELYKRSQPRALATPAQTIGNIVEDLVCKTPKIWDKYLLIDLESRPKPDMTLAAKVNKEWYNEQLAYAKEKGLAPLSSSIYDKALEIAEKIQSGNCPFFAEEWEYQVEVNGELDGIEYRGYADAIGLFDVVDIKTCTDSGAGFVKQMRQNAIPTQLAMYMHAADKASGQILAIEVKPPYDWQIWTMFANTSEYDKALNIAKGWLADFVRWKKMGCPEIGPQFWGPTKEIDLYNF